MSRRTKLWVGISIYFILTMIFVLVAGQFLDSSEEGGLKPLPPWSESQIREAILKPLPPASPDPRESQRYLTQATEMFNRAATPSVRYESYNSYRLALAYSGQSYFADGLDQRRFQQVQEDIVQNVTALYGDGYKQLRGGKYKEAEMTFRKLIQQYFLDSTSELHRHVERQRNVAAHNLKKRSW